LVRSRPANDEPADADASGCSSSETTNSVRLELTRLDAENANAL
jgi:hypothetical protein